MSQDDQPTKKITRKEIPAPQVVFSSPLFNCTLSKGHEPHITIKTNNNPELLGTYYFTLYGYHVDELIELLSEVKTELENPQ